VSTLTAVETGVYLYGITEAGEEPPAGLGIDNGRIETIVVGDLAAVVTHVEHATIRAQRSNLASHHQVVRELTERATMLPCAFGTVAADEDRLREFLHANYDALLRQLNLLRGRVEMILSVYWNTSNVFEFLTAGNQELQRMRDRMFRPGREPSLEERIELGKGFESLLRQSREQHTRQVIEALRPYCADIRSMDVGGEQIILKLACLVAKESVDRFEEGVQAVAHRFDDHYNFKYGGPWAPFDFVNIQLDLSEE